MTPIQTKIARRREHLILAEGLGIEICMALGDREGAHRHRREMEALIAAREAALQVEEEQGASYFAAAGRIAGVQAEARRAVL
jgi:predicted alpha/beta superfamily hydrolase